MNARHRRAVLAVAGITVLALAACTTDAPPSRPAPVRTPSIVPMTPSASPTPATASTDYTGPSPMPAADGGPMLWVISVEQTVYSAEGWSEPVAERVGFVDVTGHLVVPLRYDGYEYCRDATGRATSVLAMTADDKVDVLDLTGTVVARIPGARASCAGDSHAVFVTDTGEYNATTYGEGLFDLGTGEVVLPIKVGRHIVPLNHETVNVREGAAEYFVDLPSDRKTPHPGYIGYPDYPVDPPWLAAADSRQELFGYLDSSGQWAPKPRFSWAAAFHDGLAPVEEQTGSHLVDSDFRQVGEDWHTIGVMGESYLVTREADGVILTGFLDADLRQILAPVPGEAFCESDDEEGTCLIVSETASPLLVRLPEGSVVNLPWAFTDLLSAGFVGDGGEDSYATRVYNANTGITFSLATPGSCLAVGERWVTCQPQVSLPREVYTASGQRTAFRELRGIPDATSDGDARYYWAISGSYQGFVDASRRWLYRESRYTELED